MSTVSIRYIVHDVDAAIDFYTTCLQFELDSATTSSTEQAASRSSSKIPPATPSNSSSRSFPRPG
jgi:catechol 2,3-dioxygenase-like lactoylglutathione lyase family enzyme